MQRGHDVDIPATVPMNPLTSDTTVIRRSAGVRVDACAISAALLAPLAADRALRPPTASSLADGEALSAPSSSARRRTIRAALLAPPAADRALRPPTASSLADGEALSAPSSSAGGARSVLHCSLRPPRIAL